MVCVWCRRLLTHTHPHTPPHTPTHARTHAHACRRWRTGCRRPCGGVPVLHDLLSDHLDVLEAVHAADVVDQDVGVGVPDASAPQVQPLLQEAKETNITDDLAGK